MFFWPRTLMILSSRKLFFAKKTWATVDKPTLAFILTCGVVRNIEAFVSCLWPKNGGHSVGLRSSSPKMSKGTFHGVQFIMHNTILDQKSCRYKVVTNFTCPNDPSTHCTMKREQTKDIDAFPLWVFSKFSDERKTLNYL